MTILKNNVWKILPLGVAICLWTIGYIFRFYEPLATSICDSFYGEYCMSAIGDPMMAYGQWLIASAAVMLFARPETLKRWSIFAGVYLVATTIALAFTNVSAGGFDFPERLTVAQIFGLLFLAITIFWVVIHTILLRRKEGREKRLT